MATRRTPAAGTEPAAGGLAPTGAPETMLDPSVPVIDAADAIVALDPDAGSPDDGLDVAAEDVIAVDGAGLTPDALAALQTELPDAVVLADGERLVYALATIVDERGRHEAETYVAFAADEAERLVRIGAALDPDAPAGRVGPAA